MLNNKNRLFMFWNIGKKVFESQNTCLNAVKKWSNHFQYRYGMSSCFSRENINLMKKFYLYFPIFTDKLLLLDWSYYSELVKINDVGERMFYYRVVLLCNLSFTDLKDLISQKMYFRI